MKKTVRKPWKVMNIMSKYTYNHAGERAIKRYGAFESMAVNGAPAGSKLDANAKYSAYVSPYYVENGSGTKSGAFSKHYYAGSDRIASKTADDAYFYFTDHLGSTTHITDRSGDVAQYAAYTPYGSLFREYRSVQPYKFNGKELDQETGYYYYGARYYDPTTALWLGTDPLKHKYPDIGAYVYCAGNPVRYVDPDGRWVAAAKIAVTAGAGVCYGLSGKFESGMVFDKYGATLFVSGTGNYFVNQDLEDGSRAPRIFLGAYTGIGAGLDYSWNSDSYAEYASSFTLTVPVGPASISFGGDGAGVGIAIGAGLAFETSPTSFTQSVSMSYDEMGVAMVNFLKKSGIMYVSYDKTNPNLDEKGNIIGFSGVVTFSGGSNILQYDVSCKAVKGEPSNQWETRAYTSNKQGE